MTKVEKILKRYGYNGSRIFLLSIKISSKKYALRSQPTDEKISVTSLTNPTAEDLKKIKDSIQLEYSTTNEDARFADRRGTLVEHPEDVIQSVNIVGNNIVVTFTDGSTKTKPVSEIVQKMFHRLLIYRIQTKRTEIFISILEKRQT